jgi:cell division protease FtsH
MRSGMGLPPGKDKPTKGQVGAHFGYWILAFIAIILFQNWWIAHESIETIAYSQFLQLVQEHKVESVQVEGQRIYGKLKEPLPSGRQLFSTTSVPPQLADTLQKGGVTFTGIITNNFFSDLLAWLLPTIGFFALWAFFWRRAVGNMGGGLMSIGRSGAKIYVETDVKTTFADVADLQEAKEELHEIINFLRDPQGYGRLGAHIPKGVLLVGPPGTGKTLLARAVAGEASVPFFSISGAEFVEMFVGVGAARVRDLFAQARAKAPAIIFIDELDALGRARGLYATGANDEKEQTLNQLLVELDGFDPRTGIVLLAATNRPEILDPALLRAGRFDRQVLVDRPDKEARAAILRLHLRKVRVDPSVTPEQIAELTPGATGADLANIVNEAALLATRRDAKEVTMADINEAVERAVAGLSRRTRVLSPEERRTVAYHELGHALVALSLPGTDPVHKVSIVPRGVGALGYTIQRPTEDRYLISKEDLENRMAVLCGGRAAERLVFGRISTGAADDLQKVTDIARSMVTRYGMDDTVGPISYERESRSFLGGPLEPPPQRNYSEATAQAIDREVHNLVESAMQGATAILTERRGTLERGAQILLERETLSGEDLQELLRETPKQPVPA